MAACDRPPASVDCRCAITASRCCPASMARRCSAAHGFFHAWRLVACWAPHRGPAQCLRQALDTFCEPGGRSQPLLYREVRRALGRVSLCRNALQTAVHCLVVTWDGSVADRRPPASAPSLAGSAAPSAASMHCSMALRVRRTARLAAEGLLPPPPPAAHYTAAAAAQRMCSSRGSGRSSRAPHAPCIVIDVH